MSRGDEPLFQETQRLSEISWVLASCLLFGFVCLGLALKEILGWHGVGRPLPDIGNSTEHWVVTGLLVVGGVVLVALPFLCRLIVEVRTSGLYVRYPPLIWGRKPIDLSHLLSHRAVTYSPIRDYGGWGIKWSPKGRVYSVSGNEGVRFEFEGRRGLMIGSQEAKRLEKAVTKMLKRLDNH